MQIIGNEFVVALKLLVGDVEEDGARLCTQLVPARSPSTARAASKAAASRASHNGASQNFGQGLGGQQRNQLRHEIRIRRRLDHHSQFHGRSFHLDGVFGVVVQRAVDDVGPMDQVGDRPGSKPKRSSPTLAMKLGAGLEVGIVKLLVALILLEVRSIFRASGMRSGDGRTTR